MTVESKTNTATYKPFKPTKPLFVGCCVEPPPHATLPALFLQYFDTVGWVF